MSRLPTVGSDNNGWGTILNDYLSVSLNTDGTIKKPSIESSLTGDITSHNHNTNNSIYQHITDNTLNTTSKTVPGAVNEILTNVNLKQPITDNTLNTTSKTVPGAINELASSAANLTNSVDIATVFTSPTFTGTPVAPTATVGTNTTQIATTEFVTNGDRYLNELKAAGFTGDLLPAFTNASSDYTTTETLTSGRQRYCMFIPFETKTYRYVYFYVGTAGVYTANNVNGICFYSSLNGTNTKITASETLSANMWTTIGLNQITLTTPITLTKGTVYKLSYMWSASATTTAPILGTWNNIIYAATMAALLGNNEQPQLRIDTQTSFGTSVSNGGLSGVGEIPLFFLKE